MLLVALATVLAVIAAACSSSDSSKSSGDSGNGKGWSVQLLAADGKALETVALKTGQRSPVLVIGRTYQVRATVPPEVASELDGKDIVLQHRQSGGEWDTVRTVPIGTDGKISATFTADKKLVLVGDYRLAVVPGGSATPSTKAENAASSAGSDVRLLAARKSQAVETDPTVTSETTTATGVVQYTFQIENNTGNDLNIYIPTVYNSSTGKYDEVEVALDNGQTTSLIYTNPPPGTAVHFRVNKQKCFAGCTNYVVNWNWQPMVNGVDVAGYTPCSTAFPQLNSGGVFTVDLQGTFAGGSSGWKVGTLSGPIAGAGAGDTTCTFALESSFANWMQNSVVAKVFVVVAVVILLVALTVATDGADAALDVNVAEDIASDAEPRQEMVPDTAQLQGAPNYNATGGFTEVDPPAQIQQQTPAGGVVDLFLF